MSYFQRDTPPALVKAGKALAEQKGFNQAAMMFGRAVEKDPNFIPAYVAWAEMLIQKGGTQSVKEALAILQKAVMVDRLNETLYIMSAAAYRMLNMKKEEESERKKLGVVKTLATEPTNPLANNNMGVLMLMQDQYEGAMEFFKTAIEANSKYDVAYRNMAMASLKGMGLEQDPVKKKDWMEKAMGFLNRALNINDRSAPNLIAMARLMMIQEKYNDCLTLLDRAEKLDSVNKEIYAIRKAVYMKTNRLEEAQQASALYNSLNQG
ncbi:MAG: hypothetical protein OEV94_08365 [Deltaproteobacteria bacterium]|nr:hypothetical protein [Deltaproteobacteria bacterium]